MNIGQLLQELATFSPDVSVRFDFAGCIPTTVASWRGVYAEPALGWAPTGYSAQDSNPDGFVTVQALMAELREATSGAAYHGWKGGEFRYNDSQNLRVDNPGDMSYTMVVGVKDHYGTAILETALVDE